MYKIFVRIKSYKYIEYILLSFLLLAGFTARIYKINNPIADWHSWRQADTASVSKTFLEKGMNVLYPRYQDISSIQTGLNNPNGYRFVEFPIFNVIHVYLYKLKVPGLSFDSSGRMVSILASVVSSFFLFLIARNKLGKWGGLIAAFFYLFIPYNIYFTRVVLPEPLSVCFGIVSVYFFLSFLEKEKNYLLYVSGIFMSLSILIKPFSIFFTLPLVYLTIEKYSFKEILSNAKILIPFLIYANIVLFPFFSWRVWMNRHLEGIPFFKWAFNGDRIRFKPAYWYWLYGERIGKLILGVWGLIPFVFGILTSGKKNKFGLLFLGGVILYTMIIATANVRHDYYQVYLIPPISYLCSQGIIVLWNNRFFNKTISRLMACISIFLMLFVGAFQIKEFYKINHPEIIEAGDAVKRLTPSDAIIIAPYNGDTAFLYQTGRWGWPAVDSSIDKIITKGASYYVSVNFADPDTKDAEKRFATVEKTTKYIIIDLKKPLNK